MPCHVFPLISACPFSIWSIKFPNNQGLSCTISRWKNSKLLASFFFFFRRGEGIIPLQDHGACQVEVFQVHSCKLDDRWLLSLSCLHWQSLWSHQWHDINSSCFTASTPQKYVFFFRFGAPDLLVDQNSLCFWTRFRFTTRIPMHGTAVAHPQAVSLGFRSFGDCEAFHRKSGAKS